MVRRTITFTGTVQGVGFRFTTESIARRFAITGLVGNEPDGSVMCVAEGEPEELDRFLAAIRNAMHQCIKGVSMDVSSATGEFHGFSIMRGK